MDLRLGFPGLGETWVTRRWPSQRLRRRATTCSAQWTHGGKSGQTGHMRARGQRRLERSWRAEVATLFEGVHSRAKPSQSSCRRNSRGRFRMAGAGWLQVDTRIREAFVQPIDHRAARPFLMPASSRSAFRTWRTVGRRITWSHRRQSADICGGGIHIPERTTVFSGVAEVREGLPYPGNLVVQVGTEKAANRLDGTIVCMAGWLGGRSRRGIDLAFAVARSGVEAPFRPAAFPWYNGSRLRDMTRRRG